MKRLLTVLAAVLMLVLPTGARAYAATSGSVESPWSFAPCFEPSFAEISWDSSGRLLVLNGGATQCGPTVPNGGFRIATYQPGVATGSAPGWNVRLFPNDAVGATRPFGVAAVPTTPGEYGVCVLGTAQERVICGLATVLPASTGRPPSALIMPLATDDPLVVKSVQTSPYSGQLSPPPGKSDPNGVCGTCF